MEHERKSFVFYGSYLDAVEKIKDSEAKLELMLAIARYGLDRQVPEFSNDLAAMAWVFIEPLLDANYQNYINGKKGGAPSESMKGNQNAKKTNPKQTENKPKTNRPKQTQSNPKQTETNENKSNVNVNDNENVNVNSHANVNGNENENDNVNVINKNPYTAIAEDGEEYITDMRKYNEWEEKYGDNDDDWLVDRSIYEKESEVGA